MEQFCSIFAVWVQISLVESKFDHLIPYVNEIKSLRSVPGFEALNDGDILAP